MKGTQLGELEEIVLLVVANLYDNAYGLLIMNEIADKCNRSISISTVHNVLQRLSEKGFLDSRYSDPTPERGGKRKLIFTVTKSGQLALERSRSMRNALWNSIPEVAFSR
ncbi:MAG: helix-turn-helix transcriptional regulator [Bacteroidota bacterium]